MATCILRTTLRLPDDVERARRHARQDPAATVIRRNFTAKSPVRESLTYQTPCALGVHHEPPIARQAGQSITGRALRAGSGLVRRSSSAAAPRVSLCDPQKRSGVHIRTAEAAD